MEPQLNQQVIDTAAAHDGPIETDAVIIGAGPVGLFQVFQLGLQEIRSHVVDSLPRPGGQPVERLHLREHTTLKTLAMIERTALVRRHEEKLNLYHADVRAPGQDTAEIPVALMERSHLTAVIVGPMQPHAIDALLASLADATRLPGWRCPNLLFMLPPNAVWIANKIAATHWPQRLQVHVIDEPLIS